jgi:predicted Zn-dependent peptidase
VVAGPVTTQEVRQLAEKWFGPIPAGEKYVRSLPQEPRQTEDRLLEVTAQVPLNALYKCWHMCSRLDKGYHAADLITEIVGSGGSSRLFQSLVKEQQLFSNIECYHFGSVENGIMAIEGKLVKGVAMDQAEAAVEAEIQKLLTGGVTEDELQKAKNKTESVLAFEDMSLMNRANNLAFYELLGDANLMNTDLAKFQEVTKEALLKEAAEIFRKGNCNTLKYYTANQNN